jgi:ABC-type transport system involved in cytochrome c biogenesis permease component
MLNLIYQEVLLQNKIHHISKHFFLFLLFGLISTVIIAPIQNMTEFGLMLSIIYIPMFLLGNNHFLLKYEIQNGDLELLLTTHNTLIIIIAKFCALSISLLMSLICILPLIVILFSTSLILTMNFIYIAILILLMSNGLAIMMAAIQIYFQRNNNFLSVMIMPFMLPNIILAGMLISNPENVTIIFMMFGVNLIIIPISLYCSGYLINNIYNI